MIIVAMSAAIWMSAMQASISAPRAAFSNCIKQAGQKALSDKMAADAYPAFLRSTCSSQAEGLKGALVSFDVKNGVKRGQATSDADAQIED